MSEKISIVIPTYNEGRSIGRILEKINDLPSVSSYEVIVVDDGSTDETAKVVESKGVKIIRHPENRGYGAAIKTGIKHAKNEVILIIDADGTYDPEEISGLLKHKDEYDMVVGARTGDIVIVQTYRKPAKWFLSKLANYLSGEKIPDLNSGIRLFKKNDVEKFFNILPSGFSFTTTVTLAYLCNNLSIKYVPINYYGRIGKSKINPLKDGFNFILLILKVITYFNPLRVFLPISFALFIAAIVVFIYSLWVTGRLMDVSVILLMLGSIQIGFLGLIADLIDKRLR